MHLAEYKPRSKLVTGNTKVEKPRYPVLDAHNHLGETFGGSWDQHPAQELIDVLDAAGVQKLVDLDGGWGEELLNRHLDHFKNFAPERFQIFGGVDWAKWNEKKNQFGEWAARQFELQIQRGAQGLKIWKNLGLRVRDNRGNLVPVNDKRLDPIWAKAAEYKVPITIHIADPVAFFEPIDEHNERYEELGRHIEWSFYGDPFPPFDTLITQFSDLIQSHPETTFIGAHVGCYAENLAWVGGLIERCPNFYVDIAARISELGRQPYSSIRFFTKYQDRILFGTDFPPNTDWYRIFYRFLETDDEYFNYGLDEIPQQGRWHIYGLDLPESILKKVYFQNASNILADNTSS